MRRYWSILVLAAAAALPAISAKGPSPFVGRWDFNMPEGRGAAWLGVTEKDGKLDVWFQPTGGNVFRVENFKAKGDKLELRIFKKTKDRPAMTWKLQAKGDAITGEQYRDHVIMPLAGARAPALKRDAPAAWNDPEPIFNGKDLTGWEPIGSRANNHWVVQDGMLVNEDHGDNLKTTRAFSDFKLHFEVNCPEHANSGFYLRGRYEVQLEYEPLTSNPPERRIGSIYGRIAPAPELPRTPGQWDVFDVTLVGREVTVVRNGVTTIDHKEIEGITGGALDANEAAPGPFYIQGDHTGGLKFRNITVALPKSQQ
jgi:hypothetical protein